MKKILIFSLFLVLGGSAGAQTTDDDDNQLISEDKLYFISQVDTAKWHQFQADTFKVTKAKVLQITKEVVTVAGIATAQGQKGYTVAKTWFLDAYSKELKK